MVRDDPTKLLFLDIDGVLNSNYFFEKDEQHNHERIMRGARGEVREWSLKKLDLLKKIHDETRCTIVMSSSWRKLYFSKHFRKRYMIRQLKKDLRNRGIVIEHCTGGEYDQALWRKFSGCYEEKDANGNTIFKNSGIEQEVTEFYERGLQINNYMTKYWKYPIKSFVVLDDDGDLHLFGENFIHTRWYIKDCQSIDEEGLTEELTKKCIAILNREE